MSVARVCETTTVPPASAFGTPHNLPCHLASAANPTFRSEVLTDGSSRLKSGYVRAVPGLLE